MGVVHLKLKVPGPEGDVVVPGELEFEPSSRLAVDDYVLLPERFTVRVETGDETVTLAETGPSWCWHIVERFDGGTERWVIVGPEEKDYVELVDVDPDTLEPTSEPEAAWWAVAAEAIAQAAQAHEDAETAAAAAQAAQGLSATAQAAAAAAEASSGVSSAEAIAARAAADAAQASALAAEIAAGATVTGATVTGDDLTMTRLDGATFTAGNVRGLQGIQGDPGPTGAATLGSAALGVVDLNTVTSPGVYGQSTGGNATVERNYPIVGSRGVLFVTRSDGSVTGLQEFTPVAGAEPRVTFKRRFFGAGSFTPWRAFTSQRVDQTAGRAIYTWDDLNSREQLIYGDTGWRDVSGSIVNGWTCSLLAVRRVGYDVAVAVRDLNPAAATSEAFWTSPAGLPGPTANLGNVMGWPTADGKSVRIGSGGTMSASLTGGTISSGVTSFARHMTIGAWPTTLPGTALGGIPNT